MKITPLKPKEVIKVLRILGYQEKRQTGSHKIFYHPMNHKIIPVPIHPKDLKKGLIRSIITQTGLHTEEFYQLLKK